MAENLAVPRPLVRLRRFLVWTAVAVAAVYLGGLGYMFVTQRQHQYAPNGSVFTLAEVGLEATSVRIPTEGGEELAGWYRPAEAGRPTILYHKGNTGSFGLEAQRFKAFASAGFGFLAFDYRGFPASPSPALSEATVLADALAAFDWLAARETDIVLWGRSLGASPATYVASRRDALALLLEAPFLSAVAVAAERYWYFPVHALMFDQFRSDLWMANVAEPVFVGHGTADATIGVHNGERLFALALNGNELWIVPDADHDDLWESGLWERARAFVDVVNRSR